MSTEAIGWDPATGLPTETPGTFAVTHVLLVIILLTKRGASILLNETKFIISLLKYSIIFQLILPC